MSFIFGGDTGMTWEQAQAKRKLAEELARANMSTPRNVGEGLNALGRALAFRGINRRAGEAEDRLRGEANAAFDAIFGGGGFGGATTSTSGPGAGPVPSVVRPEAADAYRAMNGGGQTDSALPAALVRSESGGNFRAQNDVPGSGGVGHFGRGQFSIGRMQDAKNAGVIPASMTPEQFMASPDAQRAVEAWHVSDINGFIDGNGLARFEGQTIGGVPVTREGMLNVAHLGGNNGLRRFLETGGAYNPADANGTRLSDYLAMGAGGGRSAPVGPTVSTQGRNPSNMALIQQLAQLSANPALDPGRRAIVGMLLQQNMAAMQPQSEAERLDLEMKRLELERLRNPQPNPTERQRNYEFALSLGMTPEEARSFAGAGGTTINNNTGNPQKFANDYFEERYATINDQAANAATMMGMYEIADAALNAGLETGPLAETTLALRRLGQALGMDVDENAAADAEMLKSVTNRMALMMRNPDSGMGMPGAVSDRDLTFLKDAQIGLDRSPEGNRRMLRAFMALEQRKIDLARFTDEYLAANGSLDYRYNQAVREWAKANPLFGDGFFDGIEETTLPPVQGPVLGREELDALQLLEGGQ